VAAPTLVATSVVTGTGSSHVTPSLSVLSGDVVTILAVSEGASAGNTFVAPTTTLSNGGVTQLQLHAAASNCAGGAWTFTVSADGSGTVTLAQNSGVTGNFALMVLVHRGATAATAARSAIAFSTTRTLAYTPSQADSAIAWVVGDWAAASVQTIVPTSTSHSTSTPGPSALPQSAKVGTNYTEYAALLDDQTSTASNNYGIGGSGSGPFTIVVAEIQGTASGTDVSLTGVVADLALGSPAGTVATQTNVAQTGVVANLASSAPAGTVSTQANVTLTGAVAPLSTSSPAGTVATQQNVTLTGVVANLATAAPAGTVSTGGSVSLTGVVANLATTAPAGTVATQNGVVLNGPVATLTTSAPAGSVSLGGNVNLTGTVATLTLAAPAGTVGTQRNVALSGPVSAVTLAAIAGTVATQQVVALTGAVAGLTLTAPAGTFSAQGANDGTPVHNPRAALTTPTSAATITATVGQATLTTPTSRGTLT
jgi:hypothetical protein